jgi:hypothetical protein
MVEKTNPEEWEKLRELDDKPLAFMASKCTTIATWHIKHLGNIS